MRLLLVDADRQLASFLRTALAQVGFEVDVLETACDAREAVANIRYAVVVLDRRLPDEDGLTVLRDLRRGRNEVPVLIASHRSSVAERVAGLDAGADDYLAKPFHLEELLARLQAILRRPPVLLGPPLRLANLAFDTGSRQLLVDGKPCILSESETKVLEILLRRPGHIVSRRVFDEQLFGVQAAAASNAIEVYVHRLRRQLSRLGAFVRIDTVRGVGYMLTSLDAMVPGRKRRHASEPADQVAAR